MTWIYRFCIWTIMCSNALSQVTLWVLNPGNCNDNTDLMCRVSSGAMGTSWGWKITSTVGSTITISPNGNLYPNKYTVNVTSSTTVTLTILNTELSDCLNNAEYECSVGFEQSSKTVIPYQFSQVAIEIPSPGNCDENIQLICRISGGTVEKSWGWTIVPTVGNAFIITNTGNIRPDKYTSNITSTTTLTLTIFNTGLGDCLNNVKYRCNIGFTISREQEIPYQCKAVTTRTHLIVLSSKRLQITSDRLYPNNPSLSGFSVQGISMLAGQCIASATYSGHYRCQWISQFSVGDGIYNINYTITTLTPATLTASFRTVSPTAPVVFNTTTVGSRVVIWGTSEQLMAITCTSTGGYPIQTVAWYRGSVSENNKLASTSTGLLQADGTYTVTLSHTFTPQPSDDLAMLMCQSSYPEADAQHKSKNYTNVYLYLYQQCQRTNATQVAPVAAGGIIQIRCSTSGCRPVPSITWQYQGTSWQGKVNTSLVNETYTADAFTGFKVTAEDNGQMITCIMTSSSDLQSSSGAGNINVQFASVNTTIEGIKTVVANEVATLTLICTTGTSNPPSNITWKRNGVIQLTGVTRLPDLSGDYGGVVRRENITLSLTRHDDGAEISCISENDVNHKNGVPIANSSVILNVQHKPLISSMQDIIVTEGDDFATISCASQANPLASYKIMYNGTNLVHQGTGTYIIQNPSRHDAGIYTCEAWNAIGSDNRNASLIVYYAPDVILRQSSTTVVEDSNLDLRCIATGIPDRYYFGGIEQRVGGIEISNRNGDVPGTPTGSSIQLVSLQLQDSGNYTCHVDNGIRDGNGQLQQTAQLQLLVQGRPAISPFNKGTYIAKTSGSVGISFSYYSYPPLVNEPEIRYGSVVMQRSSKASWTSQASKVSFMFYGTEIQLDGTLLILTLIDIQENDFGNYTFVLENEVDGVSRITEYSVELRREQTSGVGETTQFVGIAIGATVGVVLITVVVVVVVVVVYKRRNTNKGQPKHQSGSERRSRAAVSKNVKSDDTGSSYEEIGNVPFAEFEDDLPQVKDTNTDGPSVTYSSLAQYGNVQNMYTSLDPGAEHSTDESKETYTNMSVSTL